MQKVQGFHIISAIGWPFFKVRIVAHPIILLSRENQNRIRIKTYRGSDFADRLVPFSLKAGFRFFDESHFDEP
jgi:hypothetical protein